MTRSYEWLPVISSMGIQPSDCGSILFSGLLTQKLSRNFSHSPQSIKSVCFVCRSYLKHFTVHMLSQRGDSSHAGGGGGRIDLKPLENSKVSLRSTRMCFKFDWKEVCQNYQKVEKISWLNRILGHCETILSHVTEVEMTSKIKPRKLQYTKTWALLIKTQFP